jgi:hypothetical protein
MSCCSSGCIGCKVVGIIVALLSTLITVAAFIGLYQAHMGVSGMEFGTLNGSASIIAVVLALKFWKCVTKKMCPCQKGACADGACMPGGSCK